MEKVIDRKEYRRNNDNEKVISEDEINIIQLRIRKFLHQSLCASIIFLSISFLKYFNCIEVLNKINYCLDSEITISSLQKNGQIILNEATKYYGQLNTLVENMFYKNGNIESNIANTSGDINNDVKVNSNVVLKSGETLIIKNDDVESNMTESSIAETLTPEYESAVEGINQMSEDADLINQNYKMIVPVIGTITSKFGVRNSTNPKVSHYHSGLDIAANTGTQILAALDGEVIEAATDTYYGKYLKIKKDDIVMIYAHCSKLLVKKGDIVKKGNLIAYVGNTGNSTGPHLHFEVKYNDRLVDPTDILEIS